MADLFSTPAEHAFEHDEINQALAGPSTMGDATEEMGIEEAFEVEDTIRRIREGGYKTVSQASDRGAMQQTREIWCGRSSSCRLAFSSLTNYYLILSRCLGLYRRV
jgi:hypothetical protein